MNRYVIKKYVMANSLAEALKLERDIKPEDAWKDEKQPEPETNTYALGFDLSQEFVSYSPIYKRKKK